MDRKSLLRIVNDLNDLQENRPEGIYLYINKKIFNKLCNDSWA